MFYVQIQLMMLMIKLNYLLKMLFCQEKIFGLSAQKGQIHQDNFNYDI